MIVVEDGRKICTMGDLPAECCAHCLGHTLDPEAAAAALAELELRADPSRNEPGRGPGGDEEPAGVLIARRSSACRLCPQPVEVGDRVVAGDEGTVHALCAGK